MPFKTCPFLRFLQSFSLVRWFPHCHLIVSSQISFFFSCQIEYSFKTSVAVFFYGTWNKIQNTMVYKVLCNSVADGIDLISDRCFSHTSRLWWSPIKPSSFLPLTCLLFSSRTPFLSESSNDLHLQHHLALCSGASTSVLSLFHHSFPFFFFIHLFIHSKSVLSTYSLFLRRTNKQVDILYDK